MTAEREAAGGCSCGAIRYLVTGAPDQIVVCHCADCRRAAGAQSVAWLILPITGFKIVQGTPSSYRSSGKVTRRFCSNCESTLTYQNDDFPERMDVTIGSLDDPELFVPTRAVFEKHKISWAAPI